MPRIKLDEDGKECYAGSSADEEDDFDMLPVPEVASLPLPFREEVRAVIIRVVRMRQASLGRTGTPRRWDDNLNATDFCKIINFVDRRALQIGYSSTGICISAILALTS